MRAYRALDRWTDRHRIIAGALVVTPVLGIEVAAAVVGVMRALS